MEGVEENLLVDYWMESGALDRENGILSGPISNICDNILNITLEEKHRKCCEEELGSRSFDKKFAFLEDIMDIVLEEGPGENAKKGSLH